MRFTGASTVETLICGIPCSGFTHHAAVGPGLARRQGKIVGLSWHYLASASIHKKANTLRLQESRKSNGTRDQ